MKEYFGEYGLYFITIAVVLFAVTSLIGNYYYAHQNVKYLTDSKIAMFIFRISCVAMVFIGAQFNLALAWTLADVFMTLMATINIIAILLLSKIAIKTLNDYLNQRKRNLSPVFNPKKLDIKNTQCW